MKKQIEVTDHSKKQSYYYDKMSEISDGYHAFAELYHYRMLLQAMLFNEWALSDSWHDTVPQGGHFFDVHKSWKHFDGEPCFGGGWFIVMATLPTGQISNHYAAEHWKLFNIPAKIKAREWDGHTPQVAAERMEQFINESRHKL